MEYLILLLPVVGYHYLRAQEQRRRIVLLGNYLGKYQIEKLMQSVTDGYLRALGEEDGQRREQIWNLMDTAEQELCNQFTRFVEDFEKVWNGQTQVSTLRWDFLYADRVFPQATFDMRRVLAVHAQGIARVIENAPGLSRRDRAYTLSAELFLMQHSCHWFCRSRAVASARTLARHQTSYAQLIAAVSPETRAAYCKLTGC